MAIAITIGAWVLASLFIGLLCGRFIRVSRERSPFPAGISDEPGEADTQARGSASPQPDNYHKAGRTLAPETREQARSPASPLPSLKARNW